MNTGMRYLRSWPGCSFLALSLAIVPSTASGEPLDLPLVVADSIEEATDRLSGQLEQMFEERNAELLLVLRESLAERVLELETALMHKDRRIAELELQAKQPEGPTTDGTERGGDSETADNPFGLEEESYFEEESYAGDSAEVAPSAVDPVPSVGKDTIVADDDRTATREEYEGADSYTDESSGEEADSLPPLAQQLDRVLRAANEELESEVFRVLESRNVELGAIFQGEASGRIAALEDRIAENDRRWTEVQRKFGELYALVASKPFVDDDSSDREKESVGLYEPYTFPRESASAFESGTSKESSSLESVSATIDEASSPDASFGPEDRIEDTIEASDSDAVSEDAVNPADEHSSLPIGEPEPTHPETIPARVETLPKESAPKEEETEADQVTNEEEAPSAVEGPSNAEEANRPLIPLPHVPVGSDSRVCPHAKGERYTP